MKELNTKEKLTGNFSVSNPVGKYFSWKSLEDLDYLKKVLNENPKDV